MPLLKMTVSLAMHQQWPRPMWAVLDTLGHVSQHGTSAHGHKAGIYSPNVGGNLGNCECYFISFCHEKTRLVWQDNIGNWWPRMLFPLILSRRQKTCLGWQDKQTQLAVHLPHPPYVCLLFTVGQVNCIQCHHQNSIMQ